MSGVCAPPIKLSNMLRVHCQLWGARQRAVVAWARRCCYHIPSQQHNHRQRMKPVPVGALLVIISGSSFSTTAATSSCAADESGITASGSSLEPQPPSPSEWRRVAVEMGSGTSLRRQDQTAAAVRALQDALWRVSLTAYRALEQVRLCSCTNVHQHQHQHQRNNHAVWEIDRYCSQVPALGRRGHRSRANSRPAF